MFPQWGFFAYSADNFLIWTLVVTHTGPGRKTRGLLHLLADCSCIFWGLGHRRPGEASGAALCPSQGYRATNSNVAMGCLGVSDFWGFFWNLFWTEDQKVWNRKISVWQFFQVPFNKWQCRKTHKEELCGWVLFWFAFLFFLIWRSSHIYPIPWKSQ